MREPGEAREWFVTTPEENERTLINSHFKILDIDFPANKTEVK